MSLTIFKARLKAKYNTSGKSKLSNERIDAYADRLHKKNPDLKDDDEKGHDDKIDELNEFVDFAKIATDDDRLRTAEAKLKEKSTPKPTSEEDEDDEEDEEPEVKKPGEKQKKKERIPSYAKAIMEKLERLENEKKTTSIKEKIKGHEKIKDVPVDFYEDWVQPEKEEDVDSFAEKVATKYSTFKQVKKNEKATSLTKPVNGNAETEKVEDKEVDKILDNIMPGTKSPAA
jgi:hypothetical protein